VRPEEVGIGPGSLIPRFLPIPIAAAAIRSVHPFWDWVEDDWDDFLWVVPAMVVGLALAFLMASPGSDAHRSLQQGNPSTTSWTPILIHAECIILLATADIAHQLVPAERVAQTSDTDVVESADIEEDVPQTQVELGLFEEFTDPVFPSRELPLLYLGHSKGMGIFYDVKQRSSIRVPLAPFKLVEHKELPCR